MVWGGADLFHVAPGPRRACPTATRQEESFPLLLLSGWYLQKAILAPRPCLPIILLPGQQPTCKHPLLHALSTGTYPARCCPAAGAPLRPRGLPAERAPVPRQ